jgi:vesicle-associated membrane protein 7
MANNIDSVLARGERLTSLVESTDALATRAAAFGRGATALRRAEAWRAAKAKAAIGVAVAGVVYLGAAAVCGVGLRHCRG